MESKSRLRDLEGEIDNAMPIGNPILFRIRGYDIGINYISVSGTEDGIDPNDKEKIYFNFLQSINKNAPENANAFNSGDIENLDGVYGLLVGLAVQYYKEGE